MGDVPTLATAAGQSIRLGALPPDPARMKARPWLHDYFEPAQPPPRAADWTGKAGPAIATMLGNDRWGDCVIACHMHMVGVWTAAAAGTPAVGTTDEAVAQYHAICGPGDRGCMVQDVLDAFKGKGLTVGGKAHKILDYVAIDWTRRDMVQWAVALFGGVSLAVNLPGGWESAKVWSPATAGRIAGGHGIPGVKYEAEGAAAGLTILTWGDERLMTWDAVTSRSWVTEMYAPISEDWIADADFLASLGLDVDTLKADLQALADGRTPTVKPTPPAWLDLMGGGF